MTREYDARAIFFYRFVTNLLLAQGEPNYRGDIMRSAADIHALSSLQLKTDHIERYILYFLRALEGNAESESYF